MDFQFIDNDATRWVRMTTFNATNIPNPLMHVRESVAEPTISFYAKGIVVPEPSAGTDGPCGELSRQWFFP